MTILEAIDARHSVRSYTQRPIDGVVLDALQAEIETCNRLSGLRMQLCLNEPKAFTGFLAHYGKFENANNYIALIGKEGKDLHELCGYWGERLVLFAETLGLNTCWVAGSYQKSEVKGLLHDGESLAAVISIGYGAKPGHAHKSKTFGQVTETKGLVPEWFRNGVEAALKAPTAINQQRFRFILDGDEVRAKALIGPYAKIDLGIVKYHFEVASGRELKVGHADRE